MPSETIVNTSIGLVCTVMVTILAILNLQNHPRVKKLFLWFLCFTIVVAVLWTIFVGSSGKGGAIGIQRFVEIERKAQNDVDRAYEQQQKIAKDKEEREAYESARQAAQEAQDLKTAKKAVLGTWKCSTSSEFTVNPDDTVSLWGKRMYTYRFVDSRHLIMTGLFGLGFDSDYDVDLTGEDKYMRWHGVICHPK
jgi:hypothetical protein